MSKAEKYEKIERIGEGETDQMFLSSMIDVVFSGTYGTVYRARSLLTQEIVALKKVRLDDEDDVRFPEESIENRKTTRFYL